MLVGVNLNELTPYQQQWPFQDLFKVSSPFFPYTLSGGYAPASSLVLSSVTGYPTSIAAGMAATSIIGRAPATDGWQNWPAPPPAAYPPGAYVVLWDGWGNFSLSGDVNATFATPASSQLGGGRGVIALPSPGLGLLIQLTATWGGEAGHLRNLRMVPLDAEFSAFAPGNASAPFSPRFLALLSSLSNGTAGGGGGVMLRATGWQRDFNIASAPRGPWSTRTLPSSPTQLSPDGVAHELIAQLAIAANASVLWVSVPRAAPLDYVAAQASLYLERLGLTAAAAAGAVGVGGGGSSLPPTLSAALRLPPYPPYAGTLHVEVGGGGGAPWPPTTGPRAMLVIDAWESALRNATAALALALRATSGARIAGLDATDCPSDTAFAVAVGALALRQAGTPSGVSGGGGSNSPPQGQQQQQQPCSSAPAALFTLYTALRSRVVFVHSLAQTAYWDSEAASFAGAMGVWSLANGLPPLAAASPPPIGPPLWAFAFSRLDAFAYAAEDPTSADTLGSALGVASPGTDKKPFLSWGQAQWTAALRQAVLAQEVSNNRFAARVASISWGASGGPPNTTTTTTTTAAAKASGKAYGVFISSSAWALRTPDYGALTALAAAQRSGGNATLAALLAPPAADELALQGLLPTLSLALPPELFLDHLLRCAASGYTGVFAGDLLRAPNAPLTHGLLGRASGPTAVCSGWEPSGVVGGCWPPSPTLTALAAFAGAAAGAAAGGAGAGSGSGGAAALPPSLAYFPPPQPTLLPPSACPGAGGASGCQWGTCFRGACVCFPGVSGAGCTLVHTAPTCGGSLGSPSAFCAAPSVGINPSGLAYWSSVQLYRNLHLQAGSWVPQAGWQDYGMQGWTYGTPPPLLPRNGYPRGELSPGLAMGAMHLRDLRGHYIPGTYVIRWEGDAVLDAWMDDVKAVRRPRAGYMEVDLVPTLGLNNGLFLRVERSSPRAPLRNLTILPLGTPPDVAAAFPFSPSALAFLSNFSTIRFMDLSCTNCDASEHFPSSGPAVGAYTSFATQRPLVGDRTLTPMGMPVEHQILLANSVGANAYINIPHAWDNASISLLGAAWAAGYMPGLNLTLEYSNEVWGTLFLGGQYAQAEGLTLGMGGGSPADARFCYLGARTLQIGQLFERAGFPRERMRLVVASQFVNPDVTQRILACGGVGASGQLAAVAVAPYLDAPLTRGATGADRDLFPSPDGVLAPANGTMGPTLSALLATAAAHRAIAAAYNLTLIAYEGGQGMVGAPDSYLQQDLAIAVNRDPRMENTYTNYTLSLLSGPHPLLSQLNHFSSIALPSRYGSWGLLEGEDSLPQDSPKARGLEIALSALAAASGRSAATGARPTNAASCPTNASAASLAPSPGTPCSGAGACVDDPLSGSMNTTCACRGGYFGAACERHEWLDVSTCNYKCSGRGTCVLKRTLGFTRYWECACSEGYGGPVCTDFTCPAHCSFRGRCEAAGKCRCYEGYAGEDCSVDCGCGEHGVCTSATPPPASFSAAAAAAAPPPPTCTCDSGYAFVPSSPPLAVVRGGATYAGGTCAPQCAPGQCNAAAGSVCLRPGVCSCAPGCMYGECLLGTCSCWSGYTGPTCSTPVRLDGSTLSEGDLVRLSSTLGLNVAGVSDWSTEWLFLDLAATARPWISQHTPPYGADAGVYIWDLGVASPQNISAGGNWPLALLPGQQLATLMARDVAQRLPSGRYTVLYEGEGDLSFGFDARARAQSKWGRLEVDVALSPPGVRDNGIYMTITAVNPSNPIRNIRVLMPGTEELWRSGIEFHPAFLATWANLSALRFMDLSSSNLPGDALRHTVREWALRPTRDSFSFQARSIPLESQVHLANMLGADPWFNVHPESPPHFVAAQAALVAQALRPDLSPIVELGNELWNGLFAPAAALAAEAGAAGTTLPTLIAQRVAALAAQWDAAFLQQRQAVEGGSSSSSSSGGGGGGGGGGGAKPFTAPLPPRTILSTFTAVPYFTQQLLLARANCSLYPPARAAALFPAFCPLAAPAPPPASPAPPATFPAWLAAAGLGVSAYMDCGAAGSAAQAAATALANSVPSILAACRATLGEAAVHWVGHTAALAAAAASASLPPAATLAALPLAVYEGGPGLVEASAISGGGATPGLAELLTGASASPDMEGIYAQWLAGCALALGLGRGRVGGPFSVSGGALPYMHYSSTGRSSQYGSWGLYEYTGAPLSASPRARAFAAFAGGLAGGLVKRACTLQGAVNAVAPSAGAAALAGGGGEGDAAG